ncbi:MAG TPA: asparaginase [Pilimelia sp.]|nr:asparaginase [Pilimelia sp.]
MGARPVRVAMFSLGGTISMLPQPGGGVAPLLSGAEVLAAVPGLEAARASGGAMEAARASGGAMEAARASGGAMDATGIAVEVHDFRRLAGSALSIEDVHLLAVEIRRRVAAGIDGVVVTQGTDTIEETAYLLDLVYAGDAPLVVTGAMRNAAMAGADGPANLLAAVRVAASAEARGLGCLVVFADEVHAARYVRKAHTTRITAFVSYPGPIGYVVESAVRVALRPVRSQVVDGVDPGRRVETAVVLATLGDGGALLRAATAQVDGLVVAGFGAGHVPVPWVPILAESAARIPVVLASRTGAGSVLADTYGFAGSESDLFSRGLISAGSLDAVKARLHLHLLLQAGVDWAGIDGALAIAGDRATPPEH